MARKETHRTAWLKSYLDEGMPTFLNASASARAAGYRAKTDDSFRAIGYQNRKKVAPKIAKWLDDHGFSDTRLKVKVLQLMEAKETRFFAHEGMVTDQRDVEALAIQVKATEMALKVKGLFAPERHEHSGELGARLQLSDSDRKLGQQLVQAALVKMTEAKHAKPA